ncbi:MAG TPA: universal stress protein [Chthoniobacterales bacterium]|jgi:nucleotide-binding universal stress UspA family protein|nr:universal stress protein [Chthoniobacterales bacterium]
MKILVCSDGSERARRALAFAAIIAEAAEAELTILGISETRQQQGKLLEVLAREREVLHRPDLNLQIATKFGDPVEEIIRRTQETVYDLVVIGAERKGAEGFFLPSAKAYSITESIAPPVLVVPVARAALRRILICTGGGTYIANAVNFTSKLAKNLAANVTLLTVTTQPAAMHGTIFRRQEDVDALLNSNSALARNLRSQKQIIERSGVPVTVRVRRGIVIDEILAEIEEHDYDLVVAGSWAARDTWRTYVIGNITRQIVNLTDRPVLVVRSSIGLTSLTERLRHIMKALRGKQDYMPRVPSAADGPTQI